MLACDFLDHRLEEKLVFLTDVFDGEIILAVRKNDIGGIIPDTVQLQRFDPGRIRNIGNLILIPDVFFDGLPVFFNLIKHLRYLPDHK